MAPAGDRKLGPMIRIRPGCLSLTALWWALACNEGLMPGPTCPSDYQGICGTVTFRGALPESTDVVYVVAYAAFPRSVNDLFSFRPTSPPLLHLDSAACAKPQLYALPLANGTYQWVLAAWKKQGTLSLQNADSLLREAGYFHDAADTTHPGGVVVNGRTTGIDFVVDFTAMHPVSFYFPASGPPGPAGPPR
jgi:hypothetical protein